MAPPPPAEQGPAGYQDRPDHDEESKALCQSLSRSHCNLQPGAPAQQTRIKEFCDFRVTGPPWPCTRALSLQDSSPADTRLWSLAMAGGTAGTPRTRSPGYKLWALLPGPSSQNLSHLSEAFCSLTPSIPEVLGSLYPASPSHCSLPPEPAPKLATH